MDYTVFAVDSANPPFVTRDPQALERNPLAVDSSVYSLLCDATPTYANGRSLSRSGPAGDFEQVVSAELYARAPAG